MKTRSAKQGFTLLEILVAMAIIVSIVSMVYASYTATVQSAKAYDSKMDMSRQTQETVSRMARQIRCAYGPEPAETNSSNITETKTDYFSSSGSEAREQMLHIVTTETDLTDQQEGLFEVTYKFNRITGELSACRQRFAYGGENTQDNNEWQTIMTNVISYELSFYDGRKWLNKWTFRDKKSLPNAVKIYITCEDKNNRPCRYGTIANLACREPAEKYEAEIETSL